MNSTSRIATPPTRRSIPNRGREIVPKKRPSSTRPDQLCFSTDPPVLAIPGRCDEPGGCRRFRREPQKGSDKPVAFCREGGGEVHPHTMRFPVPTRIVPGALPGNGWPLLV